MKKLPVYVKYPLVLGVVCLICGGALAGIYAWTNPIYQQHVAEKKTAALGNLLIKDGLTQDGDLNALFADGGTPTYVTDAYSFKVTGNTSDYYYYNAETAKGYEGTITFGALVDPSYSIIGFTIVDSDESSIGLGVAQKLQVSITVDNPYVSNGDLIMSGASAKTKPVLVAAFESIIASAKTIN